MRIALPRQCRVAYTFERGFFISSGNNFARLSKV
jgi:hypothetical protein